MALRSNPISQLSAATQTFLRHEDTRTLAKMLAGDRMMAIHRIADWLPLEAVAATATLVQLHDSSRPADLMSSSCAAYRRRPHLPRSHSRLQSSNLPLIRAAVHLL